MYDRNIRSSLDLVKQNTADVVHQKQHKVPKHAGSNIQGFNNVQPLLVRDYREGLRWTTGNVTAKTGQQSYRMSGALTTEPYHLQLRALVKCPMGHWPQVYGLVLFF